MGALLGFAVSNPLIILAVIATFVASGWFSDVRSYFRERQVVVAAVQPWVKAVEERDEASQIKERIALDAIVARENSKHEIARLQVELEAAELERKTMGAAECPWSDDDVRMLNNGGGAKKTAPNS